MTTVTEPVCERIAHVENPVINPRMGHVQGMAQVNFEDEAALR